MPFFFQELKISATHASYLPLSQSHTESQKLPLSLSLKHTQPYSLPLSLFQTLSRISSPQSLSSLRPSISQTVSHKQSRTAESVLTTSSSSGVRRSRSKGGRVYQSSVATLQSSVRRVRSEIADPHRQIRAKTLQLSNLHRTAELLQATICFLRLSKKLCDVMDPSDHPERLDLTKARQDIKAISASSAGGFSPGGIQSSGTLQIGGGAKAQGGCGRG